MPRIIFRPNPVPPPFVPPVPVDGPLTFTARQANSSVTFLVNGSVSGVSLSYSTDNGQTWNPYTFGQRINLVAEGDNVMFKGDNNSFSIDDENLVQVEMTGKIAASGSLAYLLDSNGANKALTPYCFCSLFYECTSLIQAPALPATSLASYCYSYMFEDCTSLVQAPALPATSLAEHCYEYMFLGCTSLVQAPALPATSLTNSCYYNMFRGCTSLNHVECNATDISASNCVNLWLSNVSTNGAFKKNASMTAWPSGASGIPNGWSVEDI